MACDIHAGARTGCGQCLDSAQAQARDLRARLATLAAEQREACAQWLEQAGRGLDGRGPLRAERVRSTPLVVPR